MTAPHGHHWLERQDVGEVTVVGFLIPRLQVEEDIRDLFRQIYHLADDVGRRQLVLNLGRVEYVNSAAIGKLVLLNKKVEAGGGRLALCQVTPEIHHLLEKMHLTEMFHLYADEAEALRSFAG
jgi:anti-sigma B factor antagonist